MNIAQGSLVVVWSEKPQAFFNGQEIADLKAVHLDSERNRAVLTVSEDPLLAELQAAGIIIRRG
jgi:hypothetical protein